MHRVAVFVALSCWGCTGSDMAILPPVEATLTSVALAGDPEGWGCPNGGSDFAAPGAGAEPAPCNPSVDPPEMCFHCQRSYLFLALEAGEGNTAVDVAIADIRILDSAGGSTVAEVSFGDPRRLGSGDPWNERLRPFQAVDVRYELSPLMWSGTEVGSVRVEVDLAVEGSLEPLALRSNDILIPVPSSP
jgi:hypothetical protein